MKTLVTRARRAALAIVLALSFLAALPANAQETSRATPAPDLSAPAWSFGLRAGLAQTEFYGESTGSTHPGTDLTGGAFLAYRLGPALALQSELSFTRRRGEVDHSRVYSGSKQTEYTLGFVEVPLLVKAYLPRADYRGTMPYLTAGPYASYRIYESAEDKNLVMEGVDLGDEFRDWDYGLTGGLGMESAFGRRTAFFDVRYTWGMANLFADADRPDFGTRGWTFAVGFGF